MHRVTRHVSNASCVGIVCVALLAAVAPSASAAPGEITRTVNAEYAFPVRMWSWGDEQRCSVATVVQWPAVAGSTYATAKYRLRSPRDVETGGPFHDTGKGMGVTAERRFENTFSYGTTFEAPAGFDWINVNAAALHPNDCPAMEATLRRTVEGTPRVELRITVPEPVITSTPKVLLLPSTRRAMLGTVTCPADGRCTVKAPRTVTVRIKGTTYTVAVAAPKRLGPGKKGKVSAVFPPAAAKALSKTKVRLRVAINANNQKVALATGSVQRWVRRS